MKTANITHDSQKRQNDSNQNSGDTLAKNSKETNDGETRGHKSLQLKIQ